jgi:Xaa-Pro aminopeptidase
MERTRGKNPKIPSSEFKARIDTTRRKMAEQELDCIVAFSSFPEREGHLQYLVNYHGAFPTSQHDEIYRGLGYSALIVSASSTILCPGLLFASGDLHGIDKIESGGNLPLSISKSLFRSIKKKSAKVGIVGADLLPYLYLEQLEQSVSSKSRGEVIFRDADALILDQRASKSQAEQRVMRRASEIADNAIRAAFEVTRDGSRECEIGFAAMRSCYEEGVDYIARTRIYGRGVSGVRWPIMTNRKLERGEITGIDLIGYLNGYGFDVLRLWTVGNPGAAQREFLKTAADLTEGTIEKIRAGMSGDQVSEATMKVAKEIRIRGAVASPFGHAIGLEIVENPILLPKSQRKIVKGAFLCLEPSLEKNNQSVHFEDEVLIGESGRAEVISMCPKELN